MANELVHDVTIRATAGKLSQAEHDSVVNHKFNSQATGDIPYASSATQLSRLGIGSTGQPLTVVGGVPAWGGDVALGANKLKSTNLLLKEESATQWTLKAADDSSYVNLSLANLLLRSTGAAYSLALTTPSVFTQGRTLTLTPGDADRTITLSGNPTLADWFDQAVKAASSPAFAGLTLTGDVALGANKLKTTNLLLKEESATQWAVKAANDGSYQSIQADYFHPRTGIYSQAGGLIISTANSDADALLFKSRDTGVGLVEVGKVLGAADPEFQMGLNGNAARFSYAGYCGFFGTAPQAKPTGVAVSAAGIHAALVTLGLIAA